MKKTTYALLAVAICSMIIVTGCSTKNDKEKNTTTYVDSASQETSYNDENESTNTVDNSTENTTENTKSDVSDNATTDTTNNSTTSNQQPSTEETTTANNNSNNNNSNKNNGNNNNGNNNNGNNNGNNNNGNSNNNNTNISVGGNVTGDKNPDKITSQNNTNTSSEVNKLAKAVIDKIITKNMSEFEKAKAIHDYLVVNVDYDYENYLANTIPYERYTVIGALRDKYAVCAGYAKAFEVLCQLAGLECTYVTGHVPAGYHAWNQVKIDGKWYNIDVTWDDPVYIGKPFDDHKYNNYSYFLISDEIMGKDHTPQGKVHTCSSSLNVKAYEVGAPWLDALYPQVSDLATLSKLAKEAVDSNSKTISITWDTSWLSLEDMKKEVFAAIADHAIINFSLFKCSYYNIKNTNICSCTFEYDLSNGKYIPMEKLSSIEDIKKFIEYLVYDSPTQATVSVDNKVFDDDIFYQVAVWAFEEHNVSIGFSETTQMQSNRSKSVHIHAFENTYHGSHHGNKAYDASTTSDVLKILSEHHTESGSFRVIYRYGDDIGRLSASEVAEYVKKNLAPTWASKYCFKQYEISTDDFVCVMVIRFSCANHNTRDSKWEYEKEPTCIASGTSILKCADCGQVTQSHTEKPTGVHDTYWVYDSDITKHLACKNCTYTGPVLQQYGQVWGFFDDNAATELFNGINKRRENEYYIHRDYMGNFISSETPPQLVWDTKLASQIRTFAVCVATGIVTENYADAVEYISRTTTKYPSSYIPVDTLFYNFRDLDYLRNIYLTRAATSSFVFDSDGTGLNLQQVWCIYFGE